MLLFSHLSVRRGTLGCCGSSYGDRYIHSLVVNHRRFTAFTRGYASVPTYGGNARITTSCYILFLFASGNGNYSVNFSYFLEHEPKVAQVNFTNNTNCKVAQVTPILFPCHFLAYQYSVPSSANLPNPYFKANG